MFVNANLDKFVEKAIKGNKGTVLDNGFVKQALIHGNSLKLLPYIPDNSIDHVDIDVPYLLSSKSKNSVLKAAKREVKKHPGYNASIEHNYVKLAGMTDGFPIHYVLTQLVRVNKHLNMAIWCSKNQIYPICHFFHNLHIKGLRIDHFHWDKTNSIATNKYGFDYHDCEYCLTIYQTGNDSIHGNYYTKRHDYLTPANDDSKKFGYDHPTVKPLFIIRNFIYSMTKPNDTVLDIYMGSGTSGVASKMLNRNYIGIELEKSYYDLAVKRVSESNKQAQRVVDYEISRLKDDYHMYRFAKKADERIKASLNKDIELEAFTLFHHVQPVMHHKHVKPVKHIKPIKNNKIKPKKVRKHRHHFANKKDKFDYYNNTSSHRHAMHKYYAKSQRNNPRSKYYQGKKVNKKNNQNA